jgi:hypothetical protein
VKWPLLLASLAVLAVAVDRLLLWMEWRGWIDYRGTNPGRINTGQIGPAFLGIQALFQSGARHHVEEKTALRTEREASGDDSPDLPPDH